MSVYNKYITISFTEAIALGSNSAGINAYLTSFEQTSNPEITGANMQTR